MLFFIPLCEDAAELLVQDRGIHLGITVSHSSFLQWRQAATVTSVTFDKLHNFFEDLLSLVTRSET